MVYDINALRAKLQKLNNNNGKSSGEKKKDQVKLTWWKPSIGANEIRFLPYNDGSGQPFQEIGYYNSKQLSENRIVAPCQWGMPDPIQDLMNKLRKNRQDNATWQLMKQLNVRESYYAPIVVRGDDEKTVRIWEMSQQVLNQVYTKLSHPDYEKEDLFDPKEGYDFTITAVDSGKQFNGFPVKTLTLEVRRKPSPLAKTQAERDTIVAAIPNLLEHFKQYAPNEEKLNDLIANFLSGESNSTSVEGKEVTTVKSKDETTSAAKSKIDAAFDDL